MKESRSSRAAPLRACLECQKRKTKCVFRGVSPDACSYCTKTHKRCVFEAPPERTPLTRKNLDALQDRCGRLESLLQAIDPNINIEQALETSGHGSSEERREGTPGEEGQEEYGWNEAKAADIDGMMATNASGYLGSSAASNIMQSISSMLPQVDSPGSQEGRTPGFIRVKSSLPSEGNSSLAKSAATGRLIDAYFACYNTSYPILHERTFRERYERHAKVRPGSSWTAIIFMTLAIGQWCLGEEAADGSQSPYYAGARQWLSAQALESGTLGAVQAFLLMGNYLQKRDRPNTGYNVIGIAYRMALGLGMHREISSSNRNTLALERRRQVFWTMFCFDSGLSITTGRPATIIDAFLDVQMPSNIDDSYCELTSLAPDECDYPTPSSAIITQSHLAIVANEIYTQFLSIRLPLAETVQQTALQMEQKLHTWRSTLPSYFMSPDIPPWFYGPRAILFWKEQNLRIMLWRGCQRHYTTESGKVMAGLKCRAVATETINDITEFCSQHQNLIHLGLNWYATYFLFQAILVLDVHRLENAPPTQLVEGQSYEDTVLWADCVKRGRECLQMLNVPTSAAGRCLETLDRIHGLLASSEYANADKSTHLPQMQETSNFMESESFIGGSEGFTPEALNMQWTMSADPSLHMLLDDPQIDNLFRGVEGFPGTLDQSSFDYIAGDLYRI